MLTRNVSSMAKVSIFIWLLLSSLLASAQAIESTRLLAGNYQPQAVEQAVVTLMATNTVAPRTLVEYKAGQSVVLQPGFQAKTGSVFKAHTGAVSLTESNLNSLTIQAYPNPFDQVTTISYVLTRPSQVSLQISDAEGKLIHQLVSGHYEEAGRHSVEWKTGTIPAGTYICILDAGPQRLSRRIIRK